MLVGRDTKQMDLAACGRAAVESVSENLNDGVIAPLFYFCFFGIPGMLFFKVVSTLDSMVGYRNERYQDFGWCGARFDDLLSWIPARLSWLLLSGSAALFPDCPAKTHSESAGRITQNCPVQMQVGVKLLQLER